jgi:hypothetical protein
MDIGNMNMEMEIEDEERFRRINNSKNSTKYNHPPSLINPSELKNIYRYKFSESFINQLFVFSKIHEYDDRKTFKEAWEKWYEENEQLVNAECNRLTDLGYEGDIHRKMFKSARYYFRKKSVTQKEQTKRRNYIGIQKELLSAMDEHINSIKGVLKPSEGFIDFCKQHCNLLREEVNILCSQNIKDPTEIRNKIKKTYKNRHYLAIHKTG